MNHDNTPEEPNDSKLNDAEDPKVVSPKKIKKELSVVSLPHDNDVMAQEMADLFDEDRVTHKHGNAEPEKD
ncbi:hypothetical protein [Candidatus Nitrospira allomarina]|jgi:hypothetical protein|uniref:Uncharacterized protein n=1 Tax=Candidatus Nitrospira allomarina TaxID=3020900 RepID=A0AA96GE90_9BACT|nr:hypothetical protein [Candidatus Nitrospira allomarina]WNM58385.1 hypothetical protein PP769_01075 [Candidatus Nitrospira allomarina]